MIIRPPDLPRRLPAEPQCLYAVIGDEPLFVSEGADHVRAQLRQLGYDERLRMDGLDVDAIYAQTQAGSLFASRKLIEIEAPEAKLGTAGARFIKEWLAQPAADTSLLLVCHCERYPRKTAWLTEIAEKAVLLRCQSLDLEEMDAWLQYRARSMGLALTDAGREWMLARTEGHLLAAAQDLSILQMLGLSGEVDVVQLEAAVADSARFDVFALPDCCLRGELVRARRIVGRLRQEGAPGPLINFALARDLRSLIKLAKGSGERAAGIWGSRAALFAQARRRLPPRLLARLHAAMVSLDRSAKSRPEAVYWEELLNFVHVFAGDAVAQSLPLAIHESPTPS